MRTIRSEFAGGLAAAVILIAGSTALATPLLLGPVPYRSQADIPAGLYSTTPVVEDFEDGTLDHGIVASTGFLLGPSDLTDSVDGDDGALDGSGLAGHSFFEEHGPHGVTFTFPTAVFAAGIVWTDGYGTTTFEAFGPGMVSLGTIVCNIADGVATGTTGEDAFFGAVDVDGIVAVRLSNSSGGIEVDHVQYGSAGVIEADQTAWGCMKVLYRP